MFEKPSTLTALRPEDVEAFVARTCFKTGPPGPVGVELEWLVTDPADPAATVPLDRVRAAISAALPLPNGTVVTYEPGGQFELSSLPWPDLSRCWRAVAADLAVARDALAVAGLHLLGAGVDPVRTPVRQLRTPRYDAMAAFFAGRGEACAAAGPWMMCGTAAVQVCLDAGADDDDVRRRASLLDALGPLLVATFANSPIRQGRPTGQRSTRQVIWSALDPSRTQPSGGADPVAAWTRYALDAAVMAVPVEDGPWITDPGLSFREWVSGAGPRAATVDDLTFHLSTLFPPVRPRGWFEVRCIDAQRGDDWAVPLAFVTALVEDPVATVVATDAAAVVRDRWEVARRRGLADAALHEAAVACMQAVLVALNHGGQDAALIRHVESFADRYVLPGRCPADDALATPLEPQWSLT